MTVITIRLAVGSDGAISGAAPLPPGEYEAAVTVHDRPARQPPTLPLHADALPIHDFGPWPDGLSLRREDMCGDDGR